MDRLRKTPKILIVIICMIVTGFLMLGVQNFDFNRRLSYFKQESYILEDEELGFWDVTPSRFNLSDFRRRIEYIDSTHLHVSYKELRQEATAIKDREGVCVVYFNRRYGSIWVFDNRPEDSVKTVYYWQQVFNRFLYR